MFCLQSVLKHLTVLNTQEMCNSKGGEFEKVKSYLSQLSTLLCEGVLLHRVCQCRDIDNILHAYYNITYM